MQEKLVEEEKEETKKVPSFWESPDEDNMKAKIERIKEQRMKGELLKTKYRQIFGGIPNSVWDINFSLNSNIPDYVKGQQEDAESFEKSIKDLSLRKTISESGATLSLKSVRHAKEGGGISIFPFDLANRIVNFYTEKGDIIFDPFSGHCTRSYTCYLNDRNYVGYDIFQKFVDENNKEIEKVTKNALVSKDLFIKVFRGDSRKLPFLNSSFDFAFTSPPYYSLEFYSDDPEQLGLNTTYPQFLEGLFQVFQEVYRVLKNGSFFVVNCNDFRLDGEFYIYHANVAELLKKSGFKIHDVVIVNWGISIGQAFINEFSERKTMGKSHEFLIVGRKDDESCLNLEKNQVLEFLKTLDDKPQIDEYLVNKIIEENKGLVSREGAIRMIMLNKEK